MLPSRPMELLKCMLLPCSERLMPVKGTIQDIKTPVLGVFIHGSHSAANSRAAVDWV